MISRYRARLPGRRADRPGTGVRPRARQGVFAVTGILYVIDVLWPLGHPRKRALHDLIASTRVVVTRDRA